MLPCIWPRYHHHRGAGWAYRLIVVCWLWVVSYVGIRRVIYHAIGNTLLTRWRWASSSASELLAQQPPCQIGHCAAFSGQKKHWGMMCGGSGGKIRGIRLGDEFYYTMGHRTLINHGGRCCPTATAFKHTTISQHTMEQVYIVNTRKSIINNVY